MKIPSLIPHAPSLVLALVCASSTAGAVPQAPVITYGLVRDEFGVPFSKASAVTLELVRDGARAGTVYARCAVGDSGVPGMNYRLSLEIDSDGPTRANAVCAGTEMFVRATAGDTERPLFPNAVFAVPAQGAKQRLDFSTGTDADGDGLPDEWERWVLENAPAWRGGAATDADVAAFRPDGDADGDGMTNLQEYLAGTDPFLATDLFKVESFEILPGSDRARLVFLSAEGRTYRIVSAEAPGADWTPVATTRTEGAELAYESYRGTGRRIAVYLDARLAAQFFRVTAD